LLAAHPCRHGTNPTNNAGQHAVQRGPLARDLLQLCHHEVVLDVEAWSGCVPVPTFAPADPVEVVSPGAGSANAASRLPLHVKITAVYAGAYH